MKHYLEYCRTHKLRITVALETVLRSLHESESPLSLQDLEKNEALTQICDRATIFRTLQRLENIGLLRRLNFSHSGAKFSLNTGEKHKEYLICKECGEITVLNISCPVHSLEQDLASRYGYSEISHELTFYGVCTVCEPAS